MECARAKQLASLAFPFGADNGASSFGKISAISREDAAARERVVQIPMRRRSNRDALFNSPRVVRLATSRAFLLGQARIADKMHASRRAPAAQNDD
jgi:hypothetical protein